MHLTDIQRAMAMVNGVREIHDLHVWSICSGHVALSAHVTVANTGEENAIAIMKGVKDILTSQFGIEHTTIQLECNACGQGRSFALSAHRKGMTYHDYDQSQQFS
jgi:cobalt-zinc-cadmium efflux system protein